MDDTVEEDDFIEEDEILLENGVEEDGLNEEDVWNDYKKDFEVIHPPKILPLGKVSELLNSGLTPFQHKENNKYFEMVWNSLNDGGLSINMNGKNLIKVESENGFRIQ